MPSSAKQVHHTVEVLESWNNITDFAHEFKVVMPFIYMACVTTCIENSAEGDHIWSYIFFNHSVNHLKIACSLSPSWAYPACDQCIPGDCTSHLKLVKHFLCFSNQARPGIHVN